MSKTATYALIQSQTLGSATATVTFSSIPATYTDLILVGNIVGQSATGGLQARLNSDSTSNYSYTALNGDGSSATSTRGSNQTEASISFSNSTTVPSTFITQIIDYSNATTLKTLLSRSSSNGNTLAYVNLWRKTPEVVNRIDIITSGGYTLNIGTTLRLYGIQAGNA